MRATTDGSGSVRGEEASTPASRSRTYGRRHLMATAALALGVAVVSIGAACSVGDDFKFEPKTFGSHAG